MIKTNKKINQVRNMFTSEHHKKLVNSSIDGMTSHEEFDTTREQAESHFYDAASVVLDDLLSNDILKSNRIPIERFIMVTGKYAGNRPFLYDMMKQKPENLQPVDFIRVVSPEDRFTYDLMFQELEESGIKPFDDSSMSYILNIISEYIEYRDSVFADVDFGTMCKNLS